MMRPRTLFSAVLALAFLASDLQAQKDEAPPKDPVWKHGVDLLARKTGENTFTQTTKKYSIECYQDQNNNVGVYVSETGSLTAVPAKLFKGGDGRKSKAPRWQHGLELAARKFDEKDFSKTTKRLAFEVFKDENSGGLLYICETGRISSVPPSFAKLSPKKVANPRHRYGMNLKVRKAGEAKFTKDTRKIGIEVFKDPNNDNLVYLSETGGFAVVPAALANVDKDIAKAKDPEFQHGLELAVRKQGEAKVTKATTRFGVEVYFDLNTGNLIYLCETGALAVVPAKVVTKTPEGTAKSPVLTHAFELSARKAGEEKFTKDTKHFGVEVYRDENNGATLYLSETGDLSVLADKAP
jgi:hypothetical protein